MGLNHRHIAYEATILPLNYSTIYFGVVGGTRTPIIWICNPMPKPFDHDNNYIYNCTMKDSNLRLIVIYFMGTTQHMDLNHTYHQDSAYENIIFHILGFFRFHFHPLDRLFKFVYSGYLQSRSAHPL